MKFRLPVVLGSSGTVDNTSCDWNGFLNEHCLLSLMTLNYQASIGLSISVTYLLKYCLIVKIFLCVLGARGILFYEIILYHII